MLMLMSLETSMEATARVDRRQSIAFGLPRAALGKLTWWIHVTSPRILQRHPGGNSIARVDCTLNLAGRVVRWVEHVTMVRVRNISIGNLGY